MVRILIEIPYMVILMAYLLIFMSINVYPKFFRDFSRYLQKAIEFSLKGECVKHTIFALSLIFATIDFLVWTCDRILTLFTQRESPPRWRQKEEEGFARRVKEMDQQRRAIRYRKQRLQ